MVVVTMVSEVSFELSNLRKVWYRTITMVALIIDKMQNTAIKIRLLFVSEGPDVLHGTFRGASEANGRMRPASATSEAIEAEVLLKVWTFCMAAIHSIKCFTLLYLTEKKIDFKDIRMSV